ncbi:MAG: MFS transporter [Acidimicrobiales bacterium]|nr:MFS transporter [Acidimicrobiales bacterium]
MARIADVSLFRGWHVVIGVFVTLAVTAGLGFYNASVILQAARTELDTSVSAVSGATALFFGISGVVSFLAGPLMDRFDVRWFYVAGGILGAASLAGLRWVNSVVLLYVFFAFFGAGFALAGLVPGTSVVARWFTVRRSVALSIATTGLSVGGIAITPVASALIDDRALAGAGPLLAGAWLVGVIPIALLLIRSTPTDLGLSPDGVSSTELTSHTRGATFLQARRTRFFLFLAITYALVFTAQVGALAQLVNAGTERVDKAAATAALSSLALASVIGRLVGGVVVTRLSPLRMTMALILLQSVALVLLAFADTRTALIGASVILGLSVGNLLMLQPLLLADAFGVVEYSRIYSYGQLFATAGVAAGPFVLGVVRDLASYQLAFLVGAGTNFVAVATLALAGSVHAARASWEPALG